MTQSIGSDQDHCFRYLAVNSPFSQPSFKVSPRFYQGLDRGNDFPVVLSMTRIAIFASGEGSNTLKIIEYFRRHKTITVALVACNKPGAGVVDIASSNDIPVLMIDKERFFRGDGNLADLMSFNIDFIVLAGFLWKIPVTLTNAYPSSIINIHPALLPSYGGKGMYGMNVHTAIINAGEKESGITIHYVDEHYDNGDIVFQDKIAIGPSDTPETLAGKIHTLEHEHFPRIIEQVINRKNEQ